MITNFVYQSVDGYICGPNGEFDWPVFGAEMSAYANRVSEKPPTSFTAVASGSSCRPTG